MLIKLTIFYNNENQQLVQNSNYWKQVGKESIKFVIPSKVMK